MLLDLLEICFKTLKYPKISLKRSPLILLSAEVDLQIAHTMTGALSCN